MTVSFDESDFTESDFDIGSSQNQPLMIRDPSSNLLEGRDIEVVIKHSASRAELISSSLEKGRRSEYQIDQCLRVNVPSDALRLFMSKHWQAKEASARQNAWTAVGFSVLTGIGTFATAAYSFPIISIALGVVTVASSIFSMISAARASSAASQKEGWERSPTDQITAERKKAYELGFRYVYERNLKLIHNSHHAVLLPNEVKFLFERYFEQFSQKLLSEQCFSDQQKKEWMDNFRTNNPVSKKLLEYAYGEIPLKYQMVSSDFENFKAFLQNIREEFRKIRAEKRKETDQIITNINVQRTAALLPFTAMLDYWISQAKEERDQALTNLKPEAGNDTTREKIKQDYKDAVSKYELYYAAAVLPLNAYFDSKVKEAEAQLNNILEIIHKDEIAAVAPHFQYAWGLLKFAARVYQDQYVYDQPTFQPSFVLNIPTPSAPPMIQINFVDRALHQHPQNMSPQDYEAYLRFMQVPNLSPTSSS